MLNYNPTPLFSEKLEILEVSHINPIPKFQWQLVKLRLQFDRYAELSLATEFKTW